MPITGQHPTIKTLGENLSREMFSMTAREAYALGLCLHCRKHALPRCTTEAGRQEYKITSICEVCFDALFAE